MDAAASTSFYRAAGGLVYWQAVRSGYGGPGARGVPTTSISTFTLMAPALF
jgi:hypothetical protein